MFNLGVEGLTEDMEDLLSLGLKFVPVQRVSKSKVEADVERLKIKIMWDAYWKWVEESKMGEPQKDENVDTESDGEEDQWSKEQKEEERKKERKFKGKTEKTPGGLPTRWRMLINKYCEVVKEDIFVGLKKRPKDNQSQTGRPRAICGQRYPLPCFA